MKSSHFSERGQALVVIALAAVVLFGFTALAIDGSAKFSDRRHAQNAADTAAVAAALAKVNAQVNGLSDTPTTCPPSSGSPSAVCSALLVAGLDRASSNGYGNDLTNNAVEVYSPPISGYYAGNTSYVQVIITSHVKTYFMKVLGIQQSDNIVQAVALAKKSGPLYNGAAIISMDPSPNCSGGAGSGGGSVDVGGSGQINLSGGGIFVNSNASCGYSQTSCNVQLNVIGGGVNSAGSIINMTDSTTHANCNTSGVSTSTNNLQYVIPDDIYMPDRPSVCNTHTPAGSYTNPSSHVYILNPGYYSGNFPPNAVTNSQNTITLNSGVYCITGTVNQGIQWGNGTYNTITGTGVTLYIMTGGGFTLNGGTMNLTAPTSSTDPYKGYLFIVEGDKNSHPDCKINGNGTSTVQGTIFAPYCNVTVTGSSGTDAFSAQIIGWDVKLTGGTVINFTYTPGLNAQNPRRVGLMK